jgi:hypothetical protein
MALVGFAMLAVVWFGMMIAFAYNAYEQIRYEYLDLGLICAGAFIAMVGFTFLALSGLS